MKFQIIRMKNGKQQHYGIESGIFVTSRDRWDGTFEATAAAAQKIFAAISSNARKTSACSLPRLHEVIG
jgi:hypothetical protein